MGRAAKRKRAKRNNKSVERREIRWDQILEIEEAQDSSKAVEEYNNREETDLSWIKNVAIRMAIDDYFSDPELLSWANEIWEGRTFSVNGERYDAQTYVEALKASVLRPGGFDHDHRIVVLSKTEGITMGGINMETGIPWINPNFPRNPSALKGVYRLSDLLPDWKKSLLDFISSVKSTSVVTV